ncbi:choline dehydrogenase [Marivibrio halodurans]|uniref:Choline dehydrogenase n=1 Tax=Marivibrio halodurans TaxID=2039722 RepID=A0A8J7V2A5_9PROT|nr:choline dehydrogenase [Marivibrio halodurans]MBP5856961.1 choline dehydrogenase [Marivibrio halodurans]
MTAGTGPTGRAAGLYDYIVIGAGTAGCAVARRLAERDGARVALVETGGRDGHWALTMPAGLRSVFKGRSRFNYGYRSEPQGHLDDRRVDQPRGRVLGGSSSINGMTFLRGHPRDYDGWASDHGCTGWGFAECLPYFRRLEDAAWTDDPARGHGGPVAVSRMTDLSPLNAAFLAAGMEAGHAQVRDFNAAMVAGVGRFEMSVAHGRRSSAARAYLHAAGRPAGLTVLPNRKALRLLFEGTRATGVEIAGPDGVERLEAGREVILSAGVFGSPHLLMLSGIGPEEELARHGIACRLAAPGVGANLQDHLEAHIQVRTDKPVSLNRYLRADRMVRVGLQWFLAKSGPAAVNQCHVGAFLPSAPEFADWPDIQMHFFPVFFGADWMPDPRVEGYRLGCGPMRPESRGCVGLRSADPADAPLIDPNYLATEEDRRVMREGLRLGREILAQPAFADFHVAEDLPGPGVTDGAALDAFIRRDASSAYHPCGTVRMGADADDMAPLTPDLRVKGVEGLRVVDASAMPTVPSANINCPTFMLAEKAADMIGA